MKSSWSGDGVREHRRLQFARPLHHPRHAGDACCRSRTTTACAIFQSPGWVVINHEMIHEQRFIPLDGRPPLAGGHRQAWLGSSRGRWEGDALVVETTNFNGLSPMVIVGPSNGTAGIPTSTAMKIIERFTPYGQGKLYYEAWVEDPVVLDRRRSRSAYPWAPRRRLSSRSNTPATKATR